MLALREHPARPLPLRRAVQAWLEAQGRLRWTQVWLEGQTHPHRCAWAAPAQAGAAKALAARKGGAPALPPHPPQQLRSAQQQWASEAAASWAPPAVGGPAAGQPAQRGVQPGAAAPGPLPAALAAFPPLPPAALSGPFSLIYNGVVHLRCHGCGQYFPAPGFTSHALSCPGAASLLCAAASPPWLPPRR